MRFWGIVLAAVLASAAPVRAESDWARQFFENRPRPQQVPAQPASRGAKAPLVRPAEPATVFGFPLATPETANEPGKEINKDPLKDPLKKETVFERPNLVPGKGPWQWRIIKASWSAEDEAGFEEFVRLIGESDCKTVHECITSPVANPRWHASSPPYMQFYADCADLPYFLRGYFAWKNGLPFSFSIRFGAHPRTPGEKGGVTGNQIVERYSIVGPGPDARLALPTIGRYVSSEHFRTPPAYAGKLLPDFYPVALTRASIRPGTVIFDPDGHVAVVVFKVTEKGLIHYIDSHPDNSLTRGIYGRDFARALPQMGAGFKRWRPQTLVGATPAGDGTLVGGQIVLKADAELADWSDEQFYGNAGGPRPKLWSDGKFAINGVQTDYYDYVRLKLAYPGFKYDPLDETRRRMQMLCDDLKERVAAVDLAIRAGLHRRPQPPRLPNNIYATSGEWEVYSTPSRDARLKASFEELRDEIARFLDMAKTDSKLLTYSGSDLRGDLEQVYRAESAACSITYTKSDGTPQTIGYRDAVRRLFDMSFDPYHCVERRWGATDPAELRACPDGPDKQAWYVAEGRLRNQLTRTYGEPMGWTLAQLQDKTLDIGFDEPPDVDVEAVLDGRVTFAELQEFEEPAPRRQARSRRGAAPPAAVRPARHRLVVPTGHRP